MNASRSFPLWFLIICKETWAHLARSFFDFTSFASEHEQITLVSFLILARFQQNLAQPLFGGGYGFLHRGFWRWPTSADKLPHAGAACLNSEKSKKGQHSRFLPENSTKMHKFSWDAVHICEVWNDANCQIFGASRRRRAALGWKQLALCFRSPFTRGGQMSNFKFAVITSSAYIWWFPAVITSAGYIVATNSWQTRDKLATKSRQPLLKKKNGFEPWLFTKISCKQSFQHSMCDGLSWIKVAQQFSTLDIYRFWDR